MQRWSLTPSLKDKTEKPGTQELTMSFTLTGNGILNEKHGKAESRWLIVMFDRMGHGITTPTTTMDSWKGRDVQLAVDGTILSCPCLFGCGIKKK